jgi:hypothetical protein
MDDKARKEDDCGPEADRLANYGLDPEKVFDQPMTIPADARMVLTSEKAKEGHPALVRLEPKNIDDVKRWIGVPDDVGAKRGCSCKLPSAVPGVASASELGRLHPEVRKSLYDLAHEYVHGDSRRVAAHKPTLDYLVDRSWINVVAIRKDIDIHKGAVLTIGHDIRVLFARHIRIWQGGLLRIVGDSKIDCLSIVGEYVGIIGPYDASLFDSVLLRE